MWACSVSSEADVTTDPASETVELRRARLGRGAFGKEGVRECRSSMRVARETGCTSGTPLRKAKVLTWTDLRQGSAEVRGTDVQRTYRCSG